MFQNTLLLVPTWKNNSSVKGKITSGKIVWCVLVRMGHQKQTKKSSMDIHNDEDFRKQNVQKQNITL